MMNISSFWFMSAFVSVFAVSAAAARFQWGVNGHPDVQEGYREVPIATQLDLVAESGARWYRCDWYQGAMEKDPASYDNLVVEAARRGIHILPVIFPSVSCRGDATPEQIRSASFQFARKVARHFHGKISHWELDNELDIFTMIRKGETCRTGVLWQWGDADGDKPEQYEEKRYEKVKAELLGLHAGVKSGNPKSVTIIDSAGWLHYGFFERLIREDKVPFDVLGWHWYSEMGDMTKVRGSFNLLEFLKGYGKPIWITEINRRGGSQSGNEAEQAQYLTSVARKLQTCAGIGALFIYELFDEPYFGANNPESHYGLVEIVKGPEGRWQVGRKKEAFQELRAITSQRSRGRS